MFLRCGSAPGSLAVPQWPYSASSGASQCLVGGTWSAAGVLASAWMPVEVALVLRGIPLSLSPEGGCLRLIKNPVTCYSRIKVKVGVKD